MMEPKKITIAEMCAKILVKDPDAFAGVNLARVDWFNLLQALQDAKGEEVEEEEECGSSEDEVQFKMRIYERVGWIVFKDCGIVLPEEFPVEKRS